MENNIWMIRYNEEINTLLKGQICKIYQVTENKMIGTYNSMPKRMLKGSLCCKEEKEDPG
jgi:hypothetical protein